METVIDRLISNYGLLGLLFAGMLTYHLKKEAAFDSERKAQEAEVKQLLRDAIASQTQVKTELDNLQTLIRERVVK